jgi:hypothetical protein
MHGFQSSFQLVMRNGNLYGSYPRLQAKFKTILTYGVKGSHMTTRDVEGEVWTTSLPQPTNTPVVALTVG